MNESNTRHILCLELDGTTDTYAGGCCYRYTSVFAAGMD